MSDPITIFWLFRSPYSYIAMPRRQSAWGPNADRRAKLLIYRAMKGAFSGAFSQIVEMADFPQLLKA